MKHDIHAINHAIQEQASRSLTQAQQRQRTRGISKIVKEQLLFQFDEYIVKGEYELIKAENDIIDDVIQQIMNAKCKKIVVVSHDENKNEETKSYVAYKYNYSREEIIEVINTLYDKTLTSFLTKHKRAEKAKLVNDKANATEVVEKQSKWQTYLSIAISITTVIGAIMILALKVGCSIMMLFLPSRKRRKRR